MNPLSAATFAFETPCLRTRPMAHTERELFVDLYTDAETMRFIGAPLSAASAQACFSQALDMMDSAPMAWLCLAMIDKTSGDVVGICGVPNFDATSARLELGMMLRAHVRGRGYSKQGLAALAHTLFARLPVRELWVEYVAAHAAADRLTRSVGFVRTSRQAQVKGRQVWSITREVWQARALPEFGELASV